MAKYEKTALKKQKTVEKIPLYFAFFTVSGLLTPGLLTPKIYEVPTSEILLTNNIVNDLIIWGCEAGCYGTKSIVRTEFSLTTK